MPVPGSPADTDPVVPREGTFIRNPQLGLPSVVAQRGGRSSETPAAARRLRPGPSRVRCGGGELGPPPCPDSRLGSPARGRGRGRSARAGSPRLPFLVPGKSSLRGLAASRARARCRSALARGSAAGAAPRLGAPQCRAQSLPACPPAGRRSAPGPGRRHHVTRPELEPGQVSREEGWGRAALAAPSAAPPIFGLAAATAPPTPRARAATAPGPGRGQGWASSAVPTPALARVWRSEGLTRGTGGGTTRSEDQLSGIAPLGLAGSDRARARLEAWVGWE